MLVSGGKILALGKVFGNESLVGSGTPDHPLGVNTEWLQEYISSEGDTTPYSGVSPIKIEHHKVSFNSAGFASESWVEGKNYAPSAWADNRYAKKTDLPDLEPYALKTDVYTKQQADNTFIPRTASGEWDVTEYTAGSGLEIKNHKITVSADYVLKSWLETKYYDKDTIDDKLANLGGYKVVDGDPDTHEPIYSGTDKSKWIFLTEDPDASEPDKYFEWIWYNDAWKCIGETSMDLDGYATDEELQTAINNLSATYLKKEDFHDTTYTEGANIHIYGNDNTISGRDWTPELTTIQDDVDKKLYTSAFNNWSAHAFDGYATESWVNYQGFLKADALEPYATTEWVNSNFSGKDALANEFAKYYTKNEADETFVSANTFNSYKTEIDEDLRNISASLEDKIDKTASANWDLKEYSGKDGIKIENHWVSISSDFVTPDDLTDKLKGYYTKDQTSGAEALAEEFAKYQPSGDYITSAAADEKYIPKTWSANKDFTPYSGGEGVKVENHIISLSAVPQNIEITSHDESVSVQSATDPQTGITTYDLTVLPPAAEVKISGENGVSAQYDEATSAWFVGLEQANSATYMGIHANSTELTADATYQNPETLSGFILDKRYGSGIDFTADTVILEKGMYHVDLQVDVTVPGNDPAYYTATIKPTLSNSVLTHVIDGSYAHTETLDLSFIVDVTTAINAASLQFQMYDLPAGASYTVKNLQVCEIVTVDSVLNAQGGTYTAGEGIEIDNENGINVKYNSASGIGCDPLTNQLYVKLGKGLTFDTSGAAAGTLMLDDVTEEVVETVTDLKQELDSKLTVNFNYPQITDNNYDFGTLKDGDTCICQLFAVSLQHEIIENRTVFSVYVKDTGYSQANVILGIFEYDFDGNGGTGTTNWVCDTGPVSLAKQTTHDKLEFPVTHVNPDRHVLRSDRAYYAVLAMKSDGGNGIFLASCPGYSPNVNSNPTLNWRYANVVGLDFVNPSGSLANTHWWESRYNEKNDMNRFFLQIRNKPEV